MAAWEAANKKIPHRLGAATALPYELLFIVVYSIVDGRSYRMLVMIPAAPHATLPMTASQWT
ncbi:MAG: hypothetical protein JWO42_732 [Chloroflexi bacterium]|nr:hypothetical protein [Chloroflexota bacterium]